jgi:hypothetical protein
MEAISAVYTATGIVVPAWNEANSLYQDGYGSLMRDSRVLSLQPFEALYLVERQKVSIIEEQTKERLVFREHDLHGLGGVESACGAPRKGAG